MKHFRFPFNEAELPKNGLYILFERGESAHGTDRIVRVGTHTGVNQLRSRLKQHFVNENKDRSIFRKNIGRAILNRDNDPFLAHWELDLTAHEAKVKYSPIVDFEKENKIEHQVTGYLQENMHFVVFPLDNKDERLHLEAKIIATVSRCTHCRPSEGWMGMHSPKEKICESGLWLVNQLYGEPLSEYDFVRLQTVAGMV
ncbi:hypothetical protein JZ785_10410 [Alicyclobacillus curvatus]|nr:hypothetical protein JZ785_10410 [Alicyclobacillus curvatus]